ncbi:DUF4349 domain-containing protein [Taibaiella koreensis]|uniref:DUF4349 domain-containing protein n=1 Tax=Taibaiella koreensis TaxID=1268548 RepID=UPI000E59C642|nr:DUF4349 domain-containing protein [Taibaiella koreensis]
MKTLPIMAAVAITLLMSGCARYESNSESVPATGSADPQATQTTDSAMAIPGRQFIRTSDMKFRVKDVATTTYQIEALTRNAGGFVTYTHLESTTDERNVKALSSDSALETLHYTVINTMTLRVPNNRLDSTLNAIAALVDYLDYRTIKADDVALQFKANQLTQARTADYGSRTRRAIDNRGHKLQETVAAEEAATDRRKEADEAALANLSLHDQVSFSTVSLSLYQRSQTKRWIIPNNDNADDYRPGFGLRIAESLQSGWRLVQDVIVLLTRLWLVLLLAILGYVLYRRYRPRKVLAK